MPAQAGIVSGVAAPSILWALTSSMTSEAHTKGDPFGYVYGLARGREEKGWWHSFELPDGTVIDGVNTLPSLNERLSCFPIPGDLRGKRVLDIGTWDGWFAFEMERRGATVVAIDDWDNPRFREVHARLGSQVDYRIMDFYDLTPGSVGRFDIVLFMGVLYHLKHPLLALERVCALSTDSVALSSFILQERHGLEPGAERRALMEFYETDEFGGQTDNWLAPTLSCLPALCRTAGFARVELQATSEFGASIMCYRRWLPSGKTGSAAKLLYAVHNRNWGRNFLSERDEAVTLIFEAEEKDLDRLSVYPEAGGFGVIPLSAGRLAPGVWQINCKLPPGLPSGWRDVTVATRNCTRGEPVPIAIDMPIEPLPGTRLLAASDGTTWIPGRVELTKGNILCVWAADLPDNADVANVRVELGDVVLRPLYVGSRAQSSWQINVQLPAGTATGNASVRFRLGTWWSNSVSVDVSG